VPYKIGQMAAMHFTVDATLAAEAHVGNFYRLLEDITGLQLFLLLSRIMRELGTRPE